MATVMLAISGFFFLGHALSWMFSRTKIPDLLFLIVIGYFIGPVMGWITAEDFGAAGEAITTIALIVILYEGGINTNAKTLAESSGPALTLTVVTYALSVVAGFFVATLLNFHSVDTALIVGFAIGSTSSAIVIPMVRMLSIKEGTRTTLALESAFTDVLCIILVMVVLEAIRSEAGFKVSDFAIALGPKSLLAVGLGIGSGLLGAFIRGRFPNIIPNAFAGEAWAVLTYGLCEVSGINGALAVLALGFTVGNLGVLPAGLRTVFPEQAVQTVDKLVLSEVTLILRVFFFLYLGVLVKFSSALTVGSAFVLLALIYVGRFIAVRFLFTPQKSSEIDAMTIFAMGPRGLACAVTATLPMQYGHPNGEWIRDVIFALIPLTILATGALVIIVENSKSRRWLSRLFPGYGSDSAVGARNDVA